MPDTKITALTAIGANPIIPSTFPIPMVDLTDTSMAASGTTKKVTVNQILGAGGTATLASATITGAATVGTTFGVTGVSTFAAGTALLPALTTTGDTNTGIYYPAADTFAVTTAGAERYRVDSAGNCGIGVTPSAWVAGAKALQFGAYGALAQSSSGNIELSFNSYNSGAGAYKYLQTDTASLYRASSVHSWFVAPSGTAGNAITFTQAMTLDASGNLALGQSSSALQSGGTGITIYGSTASELKFLNSTTGSSANDGTALVTSVNNFSINNRESGSVSIGTTNTQRMIVKTDGQVRFVPLAADPGGAEAGDVYYNSSSNKLKCYNGSTWNDLF
jgi:hypothetical protein